MGELLGYARVSTAGQTPQLQHDALTAAGCWRTWTDVASGAKADRPQLAEALASLRPGDTLCVWRLDRLGRSLPHLIETVRELKERGVGFRSLQEAIDTGTPGGRLIFHVFGALATFEQDLVQERTRAGPRRRTPPRPARPPTGPHPGQGETGSEDAGRGSSARRDLQRGRGQRLDAVPTVAPRGRAEIMSELCNPEECACVKIGR